MTKAPKPGIIIRHHHPEMTPEERRAALQPVFRALDAMRLEQKLRAAKTRPPKTP